MSDFEKGQHWVKILGQGGGNFSSEKKFCSDDKC